MVQEMNILRCYSCKIFQVHIVKKANKWQCKICNEKQSIQHIYYQGTGQDCRLQVQHLNLHKHIKEHEEFKDSEVTEIAEKKYNNSINLIEKPVITHSKWDKYMLPEKEYYEMGLNYDKDIAQTSKSKESTLNCTNNAFKDNYTTNENSFNVKFKDEEKTGGSSMFRNNLSRDLTHGESTHGDKNVSSSTDRSLQSVDISKNDILLLNKNSFLPRPTTTKDNSESMNKKDRIQSFNNENSCDPDKRTRDVVIIRKHVKRNSTDIENLVPQSQSNTSASESHSVMLKRSKLSEETLFRKQSLRDLIELNRSKAVKSSEQIMKKNFIVDNSNSVLKEIKDSNNIKVDETEISKSNLERKTIFETDCDDLDEILDF